jgi:hypothetical protein
MKTFRNLEKGDYIYSVDISDNKIIENINKYEIKAIINNTDEVIFYFGNIDTFVNNEDLDEYSIQYHSYWLYFSDKDELSKYLNDYKTILLEYIKIIDSFVL